MKKLTVLTLLFAVATFLLFDVIFSWVVGWKDFFMTTAIYIICCLIVSKRTK